MDEQIICGLCLRKVVIVVKKEDWHYITICDVNHILSVYRNRYSVIGIEGLHHSWHGKE